MNHETLSRQDKERKFSTKTFLPWSEYRENNQAGISNVFHGKHHMPYRLVMNRAQQKIKKLLKTSWNSFKLDNAVFQTWTLWMTTSCHEVKKLDISDRAATKGLVLDLKPSIVCLFLKKSVLFDPVNIFHVLGKEKDSHSMF